MDSELKEMLSALDALHSVGRLVVDFPLLRQVVRGEYDPRSDADKFGVAYERFTSPTHREKFLALLNEMNVWYEEEESDKCNFIRIPSKVLSFKNGGDGSSWVEVIFDKETGNTITFSPWTG